MAHDSNTLAAKVSKPVSSKHKSLEVCQYQAFSGDQVVDCRSTLPNGHIIGMVVKIPSFTFSDTKYCHVCNYDPKNNKTCMNYSPIRLSSFTAS